MFYQDNPTLDVNSFISFIKRKEPKKFIVFYEPGIVTEGLLTRA